MVATAAYTGLRLGELRGLVWESYVPATQLAAYGKARGNPITGPIFANTFGRPLDLEWLYRHDMQEVLKKAGVSWAGWHAFRRGLASNLNRLGVDDSIIQSILRHSTVATTQTHYIKTARPDAVAAMRQLSESLKCSNSAPNRKAKARTAVQ